MLDRLVLVPVGLQLGDLAEAIAYYGHTEVVYQNGQLADLVELIGIDGVLRLAESDLVTILYDFAVGAVQTDNDRYHSLSFWNVQICGSTTGKPINNAEGELEETFLHRFGKGTISRRDVKRLAAAIKVRRNQSVEVFKGAMRDVRDREFLTAVVRTVLRAQVPDYPFLHSVSVEAVCDGDNFNLWTNIDFALANRLHSARNSSEQSAITPAGLVAPILKMRTEMFHAGDASSDIWADELHSVLLRTRVNSYVDRVTHSRRSIDRFDDIVFGGRSFSDAVAHRGRTILDVLTFAEATETRRFKEWAAGAAPPDDLLAAYEKAVVSPSRLAASLPVKTMRLLLFSTVGAGLEKLLGGAGLTGLAAGLAGDAAISVLDERLLSKMKMGWRPNLWVNRTAGPFLRGHD